MKGLLLAVLLIPFSGIAQENEFKGIACSGFLQGLQQGDIALLQRKVYRVGNTDSAFLVTYAKIVSGENGNVLREIPLAELTPEYVCAFSMSNDDSSFVVVTAPKQTWHELSPFKIRKYSIPESKWIWTRIWETRAWEVRVAYSTGDLGIILATCNETVTLDVATGKFVHGSNRIASLRENAERFLKFDLSKNGKYAALWWERYMTWSWGDEVFLPTLIDFTGYCINWGLHFGSIPNYVYVWDVVADTLACKFRVPYESNSGHPSFARDEKGLLVGPLGGKFHEYSLLSKSETRSFVVPGCNDPNSPSIEINAWTPKIISPNGAFFASSQDHMIVLINDSSAQAIDTFKIATSRTPNSVYAMDFSRDSKYFSVLTKGNRLVQYDLDQRKVKWESQLGPQAPWSIVSGLER